MNPRSIASCAVPVVFSMVVAFSAVRPAIARAAQPATAPTSAQLNPAVIPADRLREAWWAQRHQSILQAAAAHSNAEVVFLGDSTFNNYDLAKPPQQDFQAVWQQFYAPRRALNLGFDGDTTSNVLWRIDHGELDGLTPLAVVLLVGSANTQSARQTPLETASGINAVVGDIAARLPGTRIVVLGILPDGASPETTSRDQAVNSRLETLFAGDRRVLYLDVGAIFYTGGALNPALFCDNTAAGQPLQPNTLGQLRLTEAIEPAISNLLGDSLRFFSRSPDAILQRASAQR
jgi:lysophospholipase L1-like esterase